ncbi:hypothetical protein AB6A40_004130 [Gnathostoma spinigerum]|uniref:Uncharacterized protein n=1 Tax=Gnathostoma spinigerum TaxID=75299 RepID=A0ABD6ECN7_9BILA
MQTKQVILVLCYISVSKCADLIRQCSCDEVRPCALKAMNAIMPCVAKCKAAGDKAGLNAEVFKKCFARNLIPFEAAISCSVRRFPNSCSMDGSSKLISKRYLSSLELAIANEVTSTLHRSGIALEEVAGITGTAQKLVGCMKSCLTKKVGKCQKKAKCGLDLPSDAVLIETGKQCAVSSGVDNSVIRSVCNCFVAAGMQQLQTICRRLNVF